MAKKDIAGPAFFSKHDLLVTKPDWAASVKGDPRKLNAKRAWVKALAAEFTGEAMQILMDVARDPAEDTASRLKAVDMILQRAWGRPEAPKDDDRDEAVDTDDLIRRITIEIGGGGQAADAGPALPPKRG